MWFYMQNFTQAHLFLVQRDCATFTIRIDEGEVGSKGAMCDTVFHDLNDVLASSMSQCEIVFVKLHLSVIIEINLSKILAA